MLAAFLRGVCDAGRRLAHALSRRLLTVTQPSPTHLLVVTLANLPRTKGALIAENVLLRQQLIVLQHSVKRVHCTPMGPALLIVLASRMPTWRQALLIVQP